MSSENVSLTRRRLLKITGFGLLAGTTRLALGGAAQPEMTGVGAESCAPLADSMRAIGQAYLKRYPAERSRYALLRPIQARCGLTELPPGGPMPAALNNLVIEDFSNDDVVYLNGWALSRTEARLAALTVV